MSTPWRRRRWKTCWRPGPGLATTPAPATCMPAPGRWWRRAAFRATCAGLRALPGIGAYTAAAIGAIAFGLPAVPVDGNVERVVARLFADRRRRCRRPSRRLRGRGGRARGRSGRAGAAVRLRPGAVRPRRHGLHARPRRPARCARGWRTAPAAGRASPPSCRARRRSPRGPLRHGVAFLADRCGRQACCCAAARRRGCWAA